MSRRFSSEYREPEIVRQLPPGMGFVLKVTAVIAVLTAVILTVWGLAANRF